MISLLEFIRTGRLGGMGVGSTRAEVALTLGPPEAWDGESQSSNARIWKYGDIEIYFDNSSVWMIFADEFRVPHMGTISFDACGIDGVMFVENMEQWLLAQGIGFKRVVFPYCDEGVRIEADSGVTFTFCAEEKGERAFLRSFARLRR